MRVLVTRAEPEAARTAAALAARGAEAVIAPLFAAEAVAAAIDSDGLAGLLVTSPRTPRFLPPSLLAATMHLPVYAVGDRTAATLRDLGFTDVRSASGDVEALARLVADQPVNGAVLHAGGEDRAGDLAAALGKAGVAVRTATVYRMVAVPDWPDAARQALSAGAIDAVLHYSPRAAATYAALATAAPETATLAAKPLHVCLSPAVARALDPLAPPRVVVAERPDEVALLAGLFDAAGLPGGSPPR
jgi:uroporphyrinogen-III synthase